MYGQTIYASQIPQMSSSSAAPLAHSMPVIPSTANFLLNFSPLLTVIFSVLVSDSRWDIYDTIESRRAFSCRWNCFHDSSRGTIRTAASYICIGTIAGCPSTDGADASASADSGRQSACIKRIISCRS